MIHTNRGFYNLLHLASFSIVTSTFSFSDTNSSYKFRLDLFKSKKFKNLVSLPYTPKLKARVHFELAVNETVGNIALSVTDCLTTPRNNIDDKLRYPLIRER